MKIPKPSNFCAPDKWNNLSKSLGRNLHHGLREDQLAGKTNNDAPEFCDGLRACCYIGSHAVLRDVALRDFNMFSIDQH